MLARAEELKNISIACKRAGISRSHFYEIKEAFEKCGPEGLAPAERRTHRMSNQTRPEVERQILDMTAQFPTHSYLGISGQLRLIGIGVSASTRRSRMATSWIDAANPTAPVAGAEDGLRRRRADGATNPAFAATPRAAGGSGTACGGAQAWLPACRVLSMRTALWHLANSIFPNFR